MSLSLRYRDVSGEPKIRYRGPEGRITAVSRRSSAPSIATIIGPKGADGSAKGSSVLRETSAAVGGHRAVAPGADGRVAHVSKGDILADSILGITTGAAASGQNATIAIAGELTEVSWVWTIGPVWLGDDGLLTQVLATTGAIIRVGTAISADTIIIEPRLIARL